MGNTNVFSYQENYSIALTKENKLGQGMYGSVYKIKWKEDDRWIFAAKFFGLPYEDMDDLRKLSYDRELNILEETSHPNVLKYYGEFNY